MVGLGITLVPSTIREALHAGRRTDDAVAKEAADDAAAAKKAANDAAAAKKAADDAAAAKKAAECKVELFQHVDFSGW